MPSKWYTIDACSFTSLSYDFILLIPCLEPTRSLLLFHKEFSPGRAIHDIWKWCYLSLNIHTHSFMCTYISLLFILYCIRCTKCFLQLWKICWNPFRKILSSKWKCLHIDAKACRCVCVCAWMYAWVRILILKYVIVYIYSKENAS